MGLSRLMTAVVASTLADAEEAVSVPQLRILVMLHSGGPTNLAGIARQLGVDRSNASRPADRLVGMGLAHRTVDGSDRRSVVLSLTSRGRRFIDSMLERRREILGGLVSRLDAVDRTALEQGVGALLQLAEDDQPDAIEASGAVTRQALLGWMH